MKKNIHPNSTVTKVFTVKKEIIELVSCLPAEFHLSMDPSNHQAWTKTTKNSSNVGKAAEYAKRYKGIEEL